MSRSSRKWSLPVAVIFGSLLISAGLLWFSPKPAKLSPKLVAPLVDVDEVFQQDTAIEIIAFGTVEAANEVSLQAQVSGRIVWIHPRLRRGAKFSAGEVLIRIDPRDYAAAVRQAEAAVVRARTELSIEEGRQEVARREWDLFSGDVDPEMANRTLALREPQLEQAKSSLASALAQLEMAENDFARIDLHAPFPCFVLNESADVGQVVSTQTNLARLVGTSEYHVVVSIPVDQVGRVKIPVEGKGEGARVRVLHSGNGSSLIEKAGMVSQLLGDLEPEGRMARLLVSVPEPLKGAAVNEVPLLLGSYVTATIDGGSLRGVYALPEKALREGERVWVVNGASKLEFRDVEVAAVQGTTILISSGLRDGDKVIVSPVSTPVPGMVLRTSSDAVPSDTTGT